MRIALRELTRRFGRFVPALVAITLLVVLLVVLGGFLDGLARSQTGVLRAQGDRLLVFAADAQLDASRSRLPEGALAAVGQVDGVAEVGTLSQVPTTAVLDDEAADVVLVGHDLAGEQVPAPAASGSALVDAKLADLLGVEVGDELAVGPDGTQLRVAELVDDVSAGAPTVWVGSRSWRELAAVIDPANPPVPQVAVVEATHGDGDEVSPNDLEAVDPDVAAATVDEVIAADDVVAQQTSTFQGIIAVTFVVTLLVVALFFVLLTIERLQLYAVLKAVGGRSTDLLGGLAVQAALVSLLAVVIGVALGVGALALVPADLPIAVVPGRIAIVAVATVAVAVIGALTTLRRLLRIDPADAIG